MSIGIPLGLTFVNAFLCYYEKQWFQSVPSSCRLLCYMRYVNDVFDLFESTDRAKLFEDNMNNKNPNINFSSEQWFSLLPLLQLL